MGQVPVAHVGSSFHIVFEGVAGRNSLGNIAIDDLSLTPGVCPSELLSIVVSFSYLHGILCLLLKVEASKVKRYA